MIRMADTKLSSAEIVPVIDCMTTGNLRAGEYVEKFEREIAKRTESALAIAVTNGTTAVIKFQKVTRDSKHIYSILGALIPVGKRDSVRDHLLGDGIESGIHYPVGLHRQPSMKTYSTDCPKTDALCGSILSIPCHHGMAIEDAEQVVKSIRTALK